MAPQATSAMSPDIKDAICLQKSQRKSRGEMRGQIIHSLIFFEGCGIDLEICPRRKYLVDFLQTLETRGFYGRKS